MPYQPFAGLQAPQGLQMQWQPNIGGEQEDQQAGGMAGLTSAADMLQSWLASRRKRGGIGSAAADAITMPSSRITDVPMQKPQNVA